MVFKQQRHLRSAVSTAALFLLSAFPLGVLAQETANPPSANAPDNSRHNKDHATTADQQKEGSSDREITKKIRQSVIQDKSLSTYAHNVKIITENGSVTLKGPVHSDEEKQKIASLAASVVGAEKVTDQITVKQ